MNKPYALYYKGVLAQRSIIKAKLEALAYRKGKEEDWDIKAVEIREENGN